MSSFLTSLITLERNFAELDTVSASTDSLFDLITKLLHGPSAPGVRALHDSHAIQSGSLRNKNYGLVPHRLQGVFLPIDFDNSNSTTGQTRNLYLDFRIEAALCAFNASSST